MHPGNFNSHGGFMPLGIKALFAAIPGAGIVFAYLGFEQADQLAGEIKDPGRNLPRAIIIAILIGTAIYVMLQVVFIGALQPSALDHGWAALTDQHRPHLRAGRVHRRRRRAWAGWRSSCGSTRSSPRSAPALIYQTSTSRVSYGLARNRYFPQVFARVDRNGVPWVSLIFAFVFGLVFLLPFPSWSALVGLVTSASVLMYAGAPLSLGAFRRAGCPTRTGRTGCRARRSSRRSRSSSPTCSSTGPVSRSIWKLGIVLVIGYILIGISMAFDQQRPPLDWKSAQWLPVYLIGMGIISWQGQFGPNNTNRIPFWWDMVIVAVFCLVIYYWAMATKLSREEMLDLINRQAVHSAEDNLPPAPSH